jgi:ubiquinone/menaquinone biosynthesis C-methylase UbiE
MVIALLLIMYPEAWKYQKCYQLENYRMGRHRVNYSAADVNTMKGGKLLLDVGCGRREVLDAAKSIGVIGVGIESIPELCDDETVFHGNACDLIFTDNSFDYVTCYDVLEHLVPGDEQKALDEFKRVCRGTVFISTNDRPSFLKEPGQEPIDLHINKRPLEAWHADMLARWPNAKFDYAGPQRDWHWVLPCE